jgi:manganese/iron transport system permease protein
VGGLLVEPFRSGFMLRALIEVLVLAVVCGVVSTVVFLRRLAFVTDALTHTMFPGVAIAFFLGESLFVGALVAAVASTVVLGLLARQRRLDQDAVLALLIASFFSVGVVVVSRRATYQSDLTALLFGRLLTVDAETIVQSAVVAVAVIAVLVVFSKELLLTAFDPGTARAQGYRVAWLDVVANACVALVVVAAARAVGTALVVVLLVTPAATARLLSRRIATMTVLAVALVAVAGYAGLVLSYDLSVNHDVRLAPGATITVLLTATFAVSATGRWLVDRRSG